MDLIWFDVSSDRSTSFHYKIQTFTKHLLVANFSAYHCARNSRSAWKINPKTQEKLRRFRWMGKKRGSYPIGSMYAIYTYIWLIFMVNVGKYAIHGSYGYRKPNIKHGENRVQWLCFVFFLICVFHSRCETSSYRVIPRSQTPATSVAKQQVWPKRWHGLHVHTWQLQNCKLN